MSVETVNAGMEEVSTVTKKQDNTEKETTDDHTYQEIYNTGEMPESKVDKRKGSLDNVEK